MSGWRRWQGGDGGAAGGDAEDEQAGGAGRAHLGHFRVGGKHAGGVGGEFNDASQPGLECEGVAHR